MTDKNATAVVRLWSDDPGGRSIGSTGKIRPASCRRALDPSSRRGGPRTIRGETSTLTMVLSEQDDVRAARECAGVLARAAGVPDPGMVEMAVGEVGNNCLEHRDGSGAAVLKLGCRPGRLILRAENTCRQQPSWETVKPEAVDGFRVGGYGLQIVRTVARDLRCTWSMGRAVVQAEFAR